MRPGELPPPFYGRRMRIRRTDAAPIRRLVLLVSACLLVVLSCGREVTAPADAGVRWVQGFSFDAIFPTVYQQVAGGGLGIQFERVHIVLRRADGSIAKDTTVLFPVGVDELPVSLNIPLSPGAPASGELMSLSLDYVNAANQVVFSGGPVTVTATPSVPGQAPPPPVQVPVRYSGPGASAAHVVASPRSLTVFEGQGFGFTAVATDASGATIPNTPIFWASLDPTIASIAAPGAGAGAALAVRGTARIVAQLLNGPKDTVTVQVLLRAQALAVQSGNAQLGAVSTALAQPLVVKAAASDGAGVAGVSVNFAVATGGGSVGSSTVTTDASGLASTPFTLGPTTGAQTVTASADGLAGSPLTFTATARSVAPVRLAFTAGPPATVAAGAVIGPLTVSALDAQGAVATTFTGTVTLALGAGAPSAPLLGTLTATAVAGVANFGDLRLNLPGSGYVLAASANGLPGVTSDAFAVIAGPAQRIAFGSYPVTGATAGVVIDPIQVIARDAGGNVATSFTGPVTLELLESPAGVTLDASVKTVAAVAGVATFNAISLTRAGQYRLMATASGLATTNGPPFPVVAGPAAMLTLISGGGQSANAGTPLARPIVVGAVDRFENAVFVAGRTVTFAASNGGSASPSSATTDGSGQVSTTWTLGGTPNLQTLTASSAGLSVSITAMAIGGAAGSMTVFGGNNQFTVANAAVLTPPSVLVKDGANNPANGVAVTFTPSPGSSITGSPTVMTGANGIAAVGGWTLGGSGSFTLTASAAGYANVVFTATVNTVPMSVTAAEKQPNGTQQFSVTGGNLGDTYTWSVNNVAGGNSTFGTITSSGFFTAPATVPTPSTFAVCAQSVQTPGNKGCINVTITVTPSAGGELIVINDVNWADNSNGTQHPGNVQFIKNLVNFTPAGSRRAATKVMNMFDSFCCENHTFTGQESNAAAIYQGEGYTPVQSTSHADLLVIPADVKLVLLVNPRIAFTNAEVNGLKTFASQGGRIVFVGEHSGYYGCCIASVENDLMTKMGAQMINVGAVGVNGTWVNTFAGHQLTAGIAASGTGGFYMFAVSYINPGPNDFVLMREVGTNQVVAAVAKIDYTLLPIAPALRQALSAPENSTAPVEPAYTSDGRLRKP
jgi:hypothetical protein